MRRAAVITMLITLMPIAVIVIDAERAAGGAPKWSISSTPNPRGAVITEFHGVTCMSTSSCIAVGDTFGRALNSPAKVLIQQWDGHRWKLMAGRSPSRVTNVLYDVACVGAADCFAVGYSYGAHHVIKPLIEHWDGTRWALMATPKISGSTGSSLSAVACPLVSSCFAVGSFSARGKDVALIEHWDGTRWSTFPSRTPYYGFAGLTDISCGSADRCVAVGSFSLGQSTQPLISRYDGHIWQTMQSAKPRGAASLTGVSCSAATNCFAIGFREGSPAFTSLIERWDGIRWQIVSAPKAKGRFANSLEGVSCASATSCFVVGSRTTKTLTRTLVERWDGNQWRVMASPNARGGVGSRLNGVACPLPAKCFAVGVVNKSLVERLQ